MRESPGAGALAMRLDVDGARESADTRRVVEATLRGIPGVLDVTTDPSTGGMAVRYKPQLIVGAEAGDAWTPAPALPALRPAPRASTLTRIAETVITVAVEVALQRILGPLFWPRRC